MDTPQSLAELLNRKKPGAGDGYQNGIRPGPVKLGQFRECCTLAGLPPLYSQENVEDPLVLVKVFDPAGSWTWFLTEWDPDHNLAFGLVIGPRSRDRAGLYQPRGAQSVPGPVGRRPARLPHGNVRREWLLKPRSRHKL